MAGSEDEDENEAPDEPPGVLDSKFYCKQLASLGDSVKLPRCLHNDRSRL